MAITKSFVTAGRAVFTIEVPEAHRPAGKQPHYTFRVEKVEPTDRFPEPAWFVSSLTGPDNTADYVYLGKLDPFTGQVRLTAKSAFKPEAFRVRILNRVLARVWCEDHASYEQFGFKTHHEGSCGRCGRALTTPQSVERGIGPECWKHLEASGV